MWQDLYFLKPECSLLHEKLLKLGNSPVNCELLCHISVHEFQEAIKEIWIERVTSDRALLMSLLLYAQPDPAGFKE